MAVRHLALKSGPSSASAREIAEQYDIPIELMAKVLQRLRPARPLTLHPRARRAATALTVPPVAISVVDVIQAIDGPVAITACSSEKNDCEQYSKCSIR